MWTFQEVGSMSEDDVCGESGSKGRRLWNISLVLGGVIPGSKET